MIPFIYIHAIYNKYKTTLCNCYALVAVVAANTAPFLHRGDCCLSVSNDSHVITASTAPVHSRFWTTLYNIIYIAVCSSLYNFERHYVKNHS
jgi:hypothetical protein